MSYSTTLQVDTSGQLNNGADVNDDDCRGGPGLLVDAAVKCAADFFRGDGRDLWIAEVQRLFSVFDKHHAPYWPREELGPFLLEFTKRNPSLVVGMRGLGEYFDD